LNSLTVKIAAEIRAELRSIIRQREDLRKPLAWFGKVDSRPEGDPRYYVLFDQNPRLAVSGLRLGGCNHLRFPDERIIDRVLEFAKSVWQLKDRLKLWVKTQGLSTDIEVEANKSQHLLISADLANWKKHGENKNRSGLAPHIETVSFDTSRSGALELYHDGATKHQELLVANNIPIPYRVEVCGNGGALQLGDAVDLIDKGFQEWLPVIQSIGVLSASDNESAYLRSTLFPSGK
jgi:hypothetical protein